MYSQSYLWSVAYLIYVAEGQSWILFCTLCNSPLFAVYLTVMISQCGNQVNNKMQSDYGIKQSPFSNSNEHYEWTLSGKELQGFVYK